jgi:hypothetical protein
MQAGASRFGSSAKNEKQALSGMEEISESMSMQMIYTEDGYFASSGKMGC